MSLTRRQFIGAVGAAGLAVTAARAAGSSYAIQGIDAASYQGNPNWAAVKAAGITFAFEKATEGTTYTNPYFAANWARLKSAGLIRGAYHYGRPGTSATAQADHFVNTVRPASGDLQLALDIETADGRTPAQVWAWVRAFLARVQLRTGRPGIIYTGYYFWRDSVGDPADNLNCPLWLAAYASDPTRYVPRAWRTWGFWQYTSSGTVSGVSGRVDRDAWNGTPAGLNKLRLP